VLDIRNLERRWLKYKLKSYAPHGALVVLSLSALIALRFIWSEPPSSSTAVKSPLTSEANLSQAKKTDSAPLTRDQMVLEPSMDFVQSFHPSIPLSEPEKKGVTGSTERSIPSTPPQVLTPPNSTVLPLTVPSSPANKSLSLNRNETKIDIVSIEHRFKETSNAQLGLFIARYYYDHGQYNEAYNFSLKTNSLNSRLEESWIIFAKSLVKLGRVEQAKKTLSLYISESNSDAARALLDSIERGSFR
jgi:hypothetical protein